MVPRLVRNIDRAGVDGSLRRSGVAVSALHMGAPILSPPFFSKDIATHSTLVPKLRPPIMLPAVSLDPAGTCSGVSAPSSLPSEL